MKYSVQDLKKTKIIMGMLFLFIFLDMVTTFILVLKPEVREANNTLRFLIDIHIGHILTYMIAMMSIVLLLYIVAKKFKLIIEYRTLIIIYTMLSLRAIINNSILFFEILV